MKFSTFVLLMIALMLVVSACGSGGDSMADKSSNGQQEESSVSGKIEDGLRVLTFNTQQTTQNFRIYRGDYVRPEIEGSASVHLVIESLEVDGQYPVAEGSKPYFKVPVVGVFPYTAGSLSGVIEAVDLTAATYSEVSASEASKLIATLDPVILDVRTDREFKDGHIANSLLIPVQVLKLRAAELDEYKDRPVFIYCRSGNRSTVASRMLIDKGFTQVINLRDGVNDWKRSGYELVK